MPSLENNSTWFAFLHVNIKDAWLAANSTKLTRRGRRWLLIRDLKPSMAEADGRDGRDNLQPWHT